jgi:hypothetical protein
MSNRQFRDTGNIGHTRNRTNTDKTPRTKKLNNADPTKKPGVAKNMSITDPTKKPETTW